MVDVVEILQHWHAGRRIGELCESLRVDPKTVRKYVAPAVAAGLVPGGPALGRDEWSALVAGWFPELVDRTSRQTSWPEFEPQREFIKSLIGTVTVATIHQRLRDDKGVTASESSLRRYINANEYFAEDARRQDVRVLRGPVSAGDEAQVDYGLLGRWRDPVSGKIRRIWGFLIVLAFSRLLFLRPVIKMDEASWVECHVLAFAYFKGVPARIVPDNLKTGVLKPDLYDPLINKSFGEMAAHYDCLIDPARVRKPRDKGRVERPVPYARDSFFAGRSEEFTSLSAMQVDALRWCDKVANLRSCRAIENLAPRVLFEAEEAEALKPLPRAAFELARWSKAKVMPDIHVKIGRALYSVPWRNIGAEVDCRQGTRSVEIYRDGVLIKSHPRIESGRQTDEADYPPEKVAFMMRTPSWCRRRAAELGSSVAELVSGLMEVNALYRLRQAQGVLGLADKHGAARLDAACARALSGGDPSYRTVKGILTAGTDAEAPEQPGLPSAAPAHLHGPEALFAIEEEAR